MTDICTHNNNTTYFYSNINNNSNNNNSNNNHNNKSYNSNNNIYNNYNVNSHSWKYSSTDAVELSLLYYNMVCIQTAEGTRLSIIKISNSFICIAGWKNSSTLRSRRQVFGDSSISYTASEL